MTNDSMTRSEFLRQGSGLAVSAVLGGATACRACAATANETKPSAQSPGGCGEVEDGARGFAVRPYQLLCMICSLAETSAPADPKLKAIFEAVRQDPDRPITLSSNAGGVYVYQHPGPQDDTPEGSEFNRKRDLDILQRMNWAPGTTLPARTALNAVLKTIPSAAGICGYSAVTSDAWRGCPKADSGDYEKGAAKGIQAIIPPRTDEEMAGEKETSLRALHSATRVTIRPHILLCAVCQYGGGTRPPLKVDNLPELLDLILHKNPDILITLVQGADWMMCAPCPSRVAKLNACVNVLGSGGLSNEKRDLDMLQKLGLHYGTTMKARELYRLIFEKIPSTQEICKRENPSPSVWWDGCGESNVQQGNQNYEKGRRELMEAMEKLA